MPEDFIDSHVKVAAVDPLDTYHSLNDLVWRGLSVAHIPSTNEPSGLLRSDGKRPDGLTLIPWKNGRCVTLDVTVTDTMVQSYLPATSGLSAERKTDTGSSRSHTLSHQLPLKLWDPSITLVSNSSLLSDLATLEGAFLKCLMTIARAPSCFSICRS